MKIAPNDNKVHSITLLTRHNDLALWIRFRTHKAFNVRLVCLCILGCCHIILVIITLIWACYTNSVSSPPSPNTSNNANTITTNPSCQFVQPQLPIYLENLSYKTMISNMASYLGDDAVWMFPMVVTSGLGMACSYPPHHWRELTIILCCLFDIWKLCSVVPHLFLFCHVFLFPTFLLYFVFISI